MALSNKHKKRIDRKFVNIEEELEYTKSELIEFKKSFYKIMMSFLFIIFCVVLLYDQIIGRFFWVNFKATQGVGWGQLVVACGVLVSMWWLKRMIGK